MPFYVYATSAFSKDKFPIRMNDFVNAAEMVSSFNNAEKAWIGWSTGRYISKNEQLQTEVDKFESVMLGLGLNPQRVNDAWQMKAVLTAQKSAQQKLEKRILEDAAIAFRAGQDGDLTTMNDYFRRIQTWTAMGNFSQKEELAVWRRAFHGNESLVDNVNRMWLERSPEMRQNENVQKFFENLNKR